MAMVQKEFDDLEPILKYLDECRQLRAQIEGINARQTEALKTEWAHVTMEITANQNTMVTRVGRIEGHVNT